uniref:Meckel syndrome type 1 protein n=1 Tax=Anopheles dirus TaxID=7168 RepID=A0A182NNA2_9DIPT
LVGQFTRGTSALVVYRLYIYLIGRLTIRQIHSLIDVPVLEGLGKKLEDEESSENGPNETRIIRWQEKLFSHYEKDYYRLKENCKTEHHKKYYHMLKTESHKPKHLFTYVDEDNYYPNDQDNRNQRQQSLHKDSNLQSMYLMADLGREVLLFSITWSPDEQIMTVYPDFNHISTNPYYHEMRESNLHMYHYALERCTPDTPLASKIPNEIVFVGSNKTIKSVPIDRRERFLMPKQLHRNALLLLEIVSASEFQYDEMHIRYRFEIPPGVKMEKKGSELASSTHASKKHNDCWHFGQCHELFLILLDSKDAQHYIDVYFEAVSIDSWHRERYLGHSYCTIPLRPHTSETTVNFVQLTNSGPLADRMEVFLVGNRRQVDLNSFYGKTQKTMLNRYANETIASGKLQLRYQVLRQHQPMVLNDGFYKATRKAKNITLKELITSYNTARERLEEFIDLKY